MTSLTKEQCLQEWEKLVIQVSPDKIGSSLRQEVRELLPKVYDTAVQAERGRWLDYLTPLLKGCEEYNGRPDCKNCGLDKDNFPI